MTTPTVANSLRTANGVPDAEFDQVAAALGRLDEHLRSFPDGSVELQLNVNERGTPSQRTMLEAIVAGQPRLVATSDLDDFDAAIAEVRDDLVRQLTDAKERNEPRHNRALRQTL